MPTDRELQIAQALLDYIHRSPSPFHAVQNAVQRLEQAGFRELPESVPWHGRLRPGGQYYLVRNGTTLAAFCIGSDCAATRGEACAFHVVGAHTDSPCLRLKPRTATSAQGYLQTAVECYGGGLWYTWFDRDLTCAGRVMVRAADGRCEPRLVHVPRPVLRVPSLAIHLDRDVNAGFAPNKQTHLLPVLALHDVDTPDSSTKGGAKNRHHSALLQVLAEALPADGGADATPNGGRCAADQLQDFDLCLADVQPPTIGGAHSEFLFAPRLDNLHSSFCALEALLRSARSDDAAASAVRLMVLFDHEECGSGSAQGAASPLLESLLRRILACLAPNAAVLEDLYQASVSQSLVISADMAHAVHPNYADRHETEHRPRLGGGPVLKVNGNQRYATDAATAQAIRTAAAACEPPVPLQEFVVRNDMPCGSTIGPITAARTGIRTVDLGAPSLSMHSIREMAHVADVDHTVRLLHRFFTA
ncbi:hypothetical protein CDCA_CDCA16G4139 [Cyanidium caldarium]|uniref:aspartyl aminopeptidase n=1 Tax=Cyanidium caldarium TaxID=2771 RepID=A0AAV9J1C3_CYACA|nr:hypothetical protein CDCA_CDCA16G4139 [Cyanidium caldarium]